MANTQRRIIDDEGKQFMPMNVEGTFGEENFITVPKLIVTGVVILSIVMTSAWLKGADSSILRWILVLGIVLVVDSLVMRYVVFEESMYYDMYKERQGHDTMSPYDFCNIASKESTDYGTILMYNDAKIGVLVKLEPGIVTGRQEGFKERHFDAVSEFLKMLNKNKLSHLHMNLMEDVGKDKRLNNLDKLTRATDNANINRVVELCVTHLKNKSQHILSESEYYLIYSTDVMGHEQFMEKVNDCLSVLMDGIYDGYEIFGFNGEKALNEFAKERFGVEYFNSDEAVARVFNNGGGDITDSRIRIAAIRWQSGSLQDIDREDGLRLVNTALKDIRSGKITLSRSVKEIIKDDKKDDFGVDIEDIRSIYLDGNDIGDTSYDNNESLNDDDEMIDF